MIALFGNRTRVLAILTALVALMVLLGPWGDIGMGDAKLYSSVAQCADAPSGKGLKACTHASPTGALMPTAVMGGLGRVVDAGPMGLQRIIRLFAVLLAALIVWQVFRMANTTTSIAGGVIAVLCLPEIVLFIVGLVTGEALWGWAALVVGVALGGVLVAVGVRIGGNVLDARAPELLLQLRKDA